MTTLLLDYRARLLDRLDSIVPDIANAVAAIPQSRWREPLRSGTTSPHAMLAYLRDLERHAYFVRIQRLLAEESPVFESFDPPDWEARYYNPNESLEAILADYGQMRATELQLLHPLTPAEWAQAGRHLTLGVHTVQWWAERALAYAEDRLRELRAQ